MQSEYEQRKFIEVAKRYEKQKKDCKDMGGKYASGNIIVGIPL